MVSHHCRSRFWLCRSLLDASSAMRFGREQPLLLVIGWIGIGLNQRRISLPIFCSRSFYWCPPYTALHASTGRLFLPKGASSGWQRRRNRWMFSSESRDGLLSCMKVEDPAGILPKINCIDDLFIATGLQTSDVQNANRM